MKSISISITVGGGVAGGNNTPSEPITFGSTTITWGSTTVTFSD